MLDAVAKCSGVEYPGVGCEREIVNEKRHR